MPTPSIQTLRTDAQQVLNLDSISAVRSVVAASLANANAGTPLNPNLTTQQLWNEFYQIVTQPKSDIESIIANQLMKFLYAPPAPGGAGANKQVIFNDGGVLAGDAGLIYDKATDKLTVGANLDIWRGASNAVTNTAVGSTTLANTTTGINNTALGFLAGQRVTNGASNTAVGSNALNGNPVTGSNNVAVGFQSLLADTSGFNNTAVGTNSLYSTTTAVGSVAVGYNAGVSSNGNYNTYLGYAVAAVATSATNCVAIGVDSFSGAAGRAHTGGNNIAVGNLAMYSSNDITGSDNIGIGRDTFRSLSSGADNVCIGRNALRNLTTASRNVSVGFDSSLTLTTGVDNTCIGNESGYRLTTAEGTVAIGAYALSGAQAVTSQYNIAIGLQAMYVGGTALSGTRNIGIGLNAGRNITTGNYNIFLGSNAGYSVSSNTGSDNIGIGRDTCNSLTSGLSNIAIGNGSSTSLTSGFNNVAVGVGSLATSSVGTYAVAIGYQALPAATNDANVAIGAFACAAVTSGQNNIAIGYNACPGVTTGSSNICIGRAAPTLGPTSSNELSIGSNTYWVATNGAAATYFPNAVTSTVLPPAGSSGFIRFLLNGSIVKVAVYAD